MNELKIHKPGWRPSRYQPEHFTNSPLWDYKLCRCSKDAGEYCQYCQWVEANVEGETDHAEILGR